VDIATIAQVASAIGTLGLTVLFGFQLRVFYRQVLVNRDTLQEMRESRTAHERPHVLVTAEYRHGTLVEVVVSNIGRGAAENITFEFSAPLESSVSYQRDSEVVPLSELRHFREGLITSHPARRSPPFGTPTRTSCPCCGRWGCITGSRLPAGTNPSLGSPTKPSGRSTPCSCRETSTPRNRAWWRSDLHL
jgi:hypothetical protein